MSFCWFVCMVYWDTSCFAWCVSRSSRNDGHNKNNNSFGSGKRQPIKHIRTKTLLIVVCKSRRSAVDAFLLDSLESGINSLRRSDDDDTSESTLERIEMWPRCFYCCDGVLLSIFFCGIKRTHKHTHPYTNIFA